MRRDWRRLWQWYSQCFVVASLLFFAHSSDAFFTFQNTASGGYYRDAEQEGHFPFYFYWNLGHTAVNGIETFIHCGVNNNLVQESWRFFVYDATITYPLTSGSDEEPFRKSRFQIGRQLFTEGFQIDLLDGIQIPIYWSSQGGVWLAGGGLHSVEQNELDFDSQIYGGSVHQRLLGALWKLGYFLNSRESDDLHLVEASVSKTWEGAPFKPTLVLKGEGDVERGKFKQGASDLQLIPWETVTLDFSFLQQQRKSLLSDHGDFLYRLFAISPQKTFNATLTWLPLEELQIEGMTRLMTYKSPQKREEAHQQEVSLSWTYDPFLMTVSSGFMESYGGDAWHGGLGMKTFFSDWAGFRVETDVAKIEKLNRISTWAYHGRSGFDFRLAHRFLVSTWAELERNHLFELNARAIVYVSHYLQF